jgi:hypothetical protein
MEAGRDDGGRTEDVGWRQAESMRQGRMEAGQEDGGRVGGWRQDVE